MDDGESLATASIDKGAFDILSAKVDGQDLRAGDESQEGHTKDVEKGSHVIFKQYNVLKFHRFSELKDLSL